MEKLYYVASIDGIPSQYFEKRESAIAFIIEEFNLVCAFRTDVEKDKLKAYLQEKDSTPNQYSYKYYIGSIKINHEFDDAE